MIAGSGPLLLSVAAYARQHGAVVSVVAEQAPWLRVAGFGLRLLLLSPGKLWQGAGYRWALRSTRYLTGCWPTAAHGSAKVEAVTLQSGGRTWTEPCEILACGFGLVPNLELPLLLGCEVRDGAVVVDDLQESSLRGVYCVGELTGIGGADVAMTEGQIAGLAAIEHAAGCAVIGARRDRGRRFAAAPEARFSPPPRVAKSARRRYIRMPLRGRDAQAFAGVFVVAGGQAAHALRHGAVPGPRLRRGGRVPFRLEERIGPPADVSGQRGDFGGNTGK